MAKLKFKHSEDWIEKLTVPTEELSPAEFKAITKHLKSCPSCHHIVTENALLDRLIQNLPVPQLPPGLPPKLLQLWEEEDRENISIPADTQHEQHDWGGYTFRGARRDAQGSSPLEFEKLFREHME